MPKSQPTTNDTAEPGGPSHPVQPDTLPVTDDRIAQRAYELYLARGAEGGHDIDDWLLAERELRDGAHRNT